MKKILIQKLKKDEGFTGQDILIAIFITSAFLSLIVTMLINLSNTSYEINKTKQMTELISKMADKIDQMGYSKGKILGIGFYNGSNATFVLEKDILDLKDVFGNDSRKYTYDVKKSIVSLNQYSITVNNVVFDIVRYGY